MARQITMATGAPTRPPTAPSPPLGPANPPPTTTTRLPLLGPGSDWHSARVSLNDSGVSQPLASTRTRRAHGSTPPKPDRPMVRKARNRSRAVGGLDSESEGVVSIIADIRHLLAKQTNRAN